MGENWRRTIERRNARELGTAAIGAVAVVFLGRGLRSAPLLAAVVWIAWTIWREGRWMARPEDGDDGVRRELVRQGRLLQRAWRWYVLPVVIGLIVFGVRGPLVALTLLGGALVAALNYAAGQKLVREAASSSRRSRRK